MINLFKKKIKEPKIDEPHVVSVPDDTTGLSGIQYHPTEHKCNNCGSKFILWFGQQRCPWCYTSCTKSMKSIRFLLTK